MKTPLMGRLKPTALTENRRSFLVRVLAAPAGLVGTASLGLSAGVGRAEGSAVEEVDLEWEDRSRQRPVPCLLYLPPGVSTPAPRPLIVFSHGLGGTRHGYRYLGSHWAAQGCASLHVQHVGSDRQLWSGDRNPLQLFGRIRDAASEAEAIARAQDLRWALDSLLSSPIAARIDASRCVVAGHSYGANTAMLAVGARLQRLGRTVSFGDARFKAAILISAPPFHGEGDPTAILSAVQVPSLHITATGDDIRIPGYYSTAEDRVAIFEAMGGPRKALAVFEGGSHSMFTDRTSPGGFELNARVKTATQALTGAFLRSVLHGDDSELQDWPRRHRPLLARFVAPGSRTRQT